MQVHSDCWLGIAFEDAAKAQAVTWLQAPILLQPFWEAPDTLGPTLTIFHIPALCDCSPVLDCQGGSADAPRTSVAQLEVMLVVRDASVTLPAVGRLEGEFGIGWR